MCFVPVRVLLADIKDFPEPGGRTAQWVFMDVLGDGATSEAPSGNWPLVAIFTRFTARTVEACHT